MVVIINLFNNIPFLRLIEFIYKFRKKSRIWVNNEFKVLYNKISINLGDLKMKLRFLFVAIMALLISGCMDTIMAVPAAAVSTVGTVVSGIWGAITSIF